MVRTIQEPLPTPTRHVAPGSTSITTQQLYTGSRIPIPSRPTTGIPRLNLSSARAKVLTTPASRVAAPSSKKRTVLGEREDNTPIAILPPSSKRKSRTSLVINPISVPLTSSQNSPIRSGSNLSPLRGPSSSSASLRRIPRPSFTRLDAMEEDVTQLLDMQAPESLSGMTTDSEDEWLSGHEEIGNVTAGRTPMPPRKSAGGWGRAVQGESRLMTPMNSQEIQMSQLPVEPSILRMNQISRLPTPPSSQPAAPASTPQRPSPPSRRRARPSPTPPRRTSTGLSHTSVEPSPNPRTKKNPRLASVGSMVDLRQPGTPRDRLEVVIPLYTGSAGKGKGKGKARASTGSQRSSLSASQSSSSSSRRISASQPTPKTNRSTPPELPSTAPQSRRRSSTPAKQSSTEKGKPKPRKSRAGRQSMPSALALYAGVNSRRKSLAPPLMDREESHEPIDLDNDPLLLKPNETDDDDVLAVRGSQTDPKRKGKGKNEGARASLAAPGSTRKIIMSFPFKPYSTAPLPPSNVPEWVPRTVRKKKVEMEYNLGGPTSLTAQLNQDEVEGGAYGYATGFDSDSDDGGFGGNGEGADDTFMGVIARRGVQVGKGRDERGKSEETVVEEDDGPANSLERETQLGDTTKWTEGSISSSPRSAVTGFSLHRSRSSTPISIPHSAPQSGEESIGDTPTDEAPFVPSPDQPKHASASPTPLIRRASTRSLVDAAEGYTGTQGYTINDHFIPESNISTSPTVPIAQTEHRLITSTGVEAEDATSVDATVEEADTTLDAVPEVWDDSVVTQEGDMDEESYSNEQDHNDSEPRSQAEEAAKQSVEEEEAEVNELRPLEGESEEGNETPILTNAVTEEDAFAYQSEDAHEQVSEAVLQETNVISADILEDCITPAGMEPIAITRPITLPGEIHHSGSGLGMSDTSVRSSAISHTQPDQLARPHQTLPNPTEEAIGLHEAAPDIVSSPTNDFPVQTFDEVARSSLSSSQISESEGDLTLEAIESGWDSEESSGEIRLNDEEHLEEGAGENLFPDTEVEAVAEVEKNEVENDSMVYEHSALRESGRIDDALNHSLSLGVLQANETFTASRPTPDIDAGLSFPSSMPKPGVHQQAISGASPESEPIGVTGSTSDAETSTTNDSSETKTSDSTQPEVGAVIAEGKIVVKLVTTVIKVEQNDEEEVEQESEEGSEEEEEEEEEEEGEKGEEEEEDDATDSDDWEDRDSSDSGEEGEAVLPRSVSLLADSEAARTSSFDTAEILGQSEVLSAAPAREITQPGEAQEPVQSAPLTPLRRVIPISTTPNTTPPRSLLEESVVLCQGESTGVSLRPAVTTHTEPELQNSCLGISDFRPSAIVSPVPASLRSATLPRPSRLSQQITADTPESSPIRPECIGTDPALCSTATQGRSSLASSPVIEEGVSIRSVGRSLLAELARAEGKGKAKDLKGVVEVSSLDPRAAARAAAILKLNHNYIEHGILPSSSTASGIPKTPKSSSSPKKLSRRKSYTSEHFSSIDSARKLTAEELLNEAELEIVVNEATPHRRRREGTAFSAVSCISGMTDLPIPGGWIRTPKRKRVRDITPSDDRLVDEGRVGAKAWGIPEWKRLEKVYRAEKEAWMKEREVKALPGGLMSWVRRSTGMGRPAAEVREWDEGRVVKRFLEIEGGADEANVTWTENDILLRVQALERRVNAKATSSRNAETGGSPTKKARKEVPMVTPVKSRSAHAATPAGLAPPSTIKRVLSWVWGSSFTPETKDQTLAFEPALGRPKGKERDTKERPSSLVGKDRGMVLPVSVAPIDLGPPVMRQISTRPASTAAFAPPRAALPRLSGCAIVETEKAAAAPPIDIVRRPIIPATSESNHISARRPLAVSTTSDTSHLGLSTSSTATSGTFPPQTPRLYPPLNQSITQRSAAIKALFPSIHPLGDSTSDTSWTTSGNTSINRSGNPFAGLKTKTSVKDLAKSFEEKGTLDLALRRVPSGASELEVLKRVRSREQN